MGNEAQTFLPVLSGHLGKECLRLVTHRVVLEA